MTTGFWVLTFIRSLLTLKKITLFMATQFFLMWNLISWFFLQNFEEISMISRIFYGNHKVQYSLWMFAISFFFLEKFMWNQLIFKIYAANWFHEKFTKEKMWGKSIIVKQKFSPRWFEYFLFSKSFEFRVYFGNMLVINTWIFGPNSFSAEIAQSVERRTLDPATRVRTPVEQLFFLSFFRFFGISLLY